MSEGVTGGSAFLEVEILAVVLSAGSRATWGPTYPGLLEDVEMEFLLVLHPSSDPLIRHTGEFFFQFILTIMCIIMLLTLESIQGVLFCEMKTYLFIIET